MSLSLIAVAELLVMPVKALILGGTKDARDIADALVARGHDVTTSLAGVTRQPLIPSGRVRVGGFGGVQGLRVHIEEAGYNVLIDATHPFAAQISANALHAIAGLGVRHIRLSRPGWEMEEGDQWVSATSTREAVDHLPAGSRVLLTIGRKEAGVFLDRPDLSGVVRSIELPTHEIGSGWTLILDRPPFELEHETSLLKDHGITHLVSKNSGGGATYDKIVAARQLRLPVIMVERPRKGGGEVVNSPADVIALIDQM